MIHRIYSVFDSAAGAFMPTFNSQRDEMAIRAFVDVCKSKDHPVAQHPKDYTLFFLGTFDDNLGTFTNAEKTPVPLMPALRAISEPTSNEGMQ